MSTIADFHYLELETSDLIITDLLGKTWLFLLSPSSSLKDFGIFYSPGMQVRFVKTFHFSYLKHKYQNITFCLGFPSVYKRRRQPRFCVCSFSVTGLLLSLVPLKLLLYSLFS